MVLKIYIIDKSSKIGTHQEKRIVKTPNGCFTRNQWVGKKENMNDTIKRFGICLAGIVILLGSMFVCPNGVLASEKYKENLEPQEKSEYEINYKNLGFSSEIEAKVHLIKLIEKNTLKKQEGKRWSQNEKIMYANFIKLCHEDISQTIRKINAPNSTYHEQNPLVAPIVDKPDLFRASGIIGQTYLTNRWTNMNSTQRTFELLICNLIEIVALCGSSEPVTMMFGIDFCV